MRWGRPTAVRTLDAVNRLLEQAHQRLPRPLQQPVALAVRTVRDALDDRVVGLAAEIAFFVLLSLPGLALALLAGLGSVARAFDATWHIDLAQQLREAASLVLQTSGTRVVDALLTATVEEGTAGILGFGFLLAFLSASRALRVVVEMVTIAYDLEQNRPGWQHRLWGAGLTLVGLVAGIVVAPLVLVGPDFGATLSGLLGGVPGLAGTWSVAYWPTAAVVVTLMVTTLFHYAAPWETPFRNDLPGAALAVALWLVGSVGLRTYATVAIADNPAYGPIAGPLGVLLWLYVTAFALLLGAEFNAELEKVRRGAELGIGPSDDED